VTILRIAENPDLEAFRRSAGKWKGTVDAEALIRNIYADRLVGRKVKKPGSCQPLFLPPWVFFVTSIYWFSFLAGS
jgi:hypothetical protein